MTARHLWLDAGGTLRAPWRILLFCAALVPCGVLAAVVLSPAMMRLYGPQRALFELNGWVELAAALGATALMVGVMDPRPWRDVGLGREHRGPALLSGAFLLGAAAIGIPTLILIAARFDTLVPTPPGAWLPAALRVSGFLLPAALAEELLFRGYIFSVLRGALGWPAALGILSVLFGLVHLANRGATPLSTCLVILAGLFLGGIVVVSGSLYASWMAHFAWNWTMAVVFHAAVSGFVYPLSSPDYRLVSGAPVWVTGGPWGPEGGAAGGAGMLGGIAYLFARRRRREES